MSKPNESVINQKELAQEEQTTSFSSKLISVNITDIEEAEAAGLFNDDSEDGMELVFVYGTLKAGYGNHRRLLANRTGVISKGEDKIKGLLVQDLGPFPAVVLTQNLEEEQLQELQDLGVNVEDYAACGEVYRVNQEVKQNLDMLEGYPDFYDRTICYTQYGPAWVYIHNKLQKTPNIVLNGCWE